jgi:hypothetical protein
MSPIPLALSLTLASTLTLPVIATPALADGGAPDSVTPVHVPVSIYAEQDLPNESNYLLAGADTKTAFVQLSLNTFGDGTVGAVSTSTTVMATAPASTLSMRGNLASVTQSSIPVQVDTTRCVQTGPNPWDSDCTSSTESETLDYVVTATTPISQIAGSSFSRQTPDGKDVVAGVGKSRQGSITVHLGDRTWTATDDGWLTSFVQLGDSSMTYVSRDGTS